MTLYYPPSPFIFPSPVSYFLLLFHLCSPFPNYLSSLLQEQVWTSLTLHCHTNSCMTAFSGRLMCPQNHFICVREDIALGFTGCNKLVCPGCHDVIFPSIWPCGTVKEMYLHNDIVYRRVCGATIKYISLYWKINMSLYLLYISNANICLEWEWKHIPSWLTCFPRARAGHNNISHSSGLRLSAEGIFMASSIPFWLSITPSATDQSSCLLHHLGEQYGFYCCLVHVWSSWGKGDSIQ